MGADSKCQSAQAELADCFPTGEKGNPQTSTDDQLIGSSTKSGDAEEVEGEDEPAEEEVITVKPSRLDELQQLLES